MREKFYFFNSFLGTARELKDSVLQAKYLMAIAEYGLEGKESDDPIIRALMNQTKFTLDRSLELSEQKSEKMKWNQNAKKDFSSMKNNQNRKKQTQTELNRQKREEEVEEEVEEEIITSSNEEVNKNKINKKNKTKKIWYSPKFEEFWKAYPLKKGKQKAFQAWTSALKWGNDPNLIIKKAWEYTLEIKHKKTEECYIKRAQGWLNDWRWDDEYDTWKTYSWVLNTDETY